jgi:hypothetical protein
MRRLPPLLFAAAVFLSCEGGSSGPFSLFQELRFEAPEDAPEPPAEVHARPVVWEIEPLPAYGGMSDWMLAGVERLLQEHAGELTELYAARLRSNQLCSGVVTAHLTTESGVLLFISLEGNTTGDEALATRMLSRMQGWDWPSSGRDVFRIHLHLRRREGAGFLNAGSRELRPLPEIPPQTPAAEEDGEPTEPEATPEDRIAVSEEADLAVP